MTNKNSELTTLNLFAINNKKVNDKMNEIIITLSNEEWNKQFSSYWKSVRELCSHIYITDNNFFNIFKKFKDSINRNDDFNMKDYVWDEKTFYSIDDYIRMREKLDEQIIEFIREITNENMEKSMGLPDKDGNINNMKYSTYIIAIFTHAIHHRGQISLYLDMLGKKNDFCRFTEN